MLAFDLNIAWQLDRSGKDCERIVSVLLMKECVDCGSLIPYGAVRCPGCQQRWDKVHPVHERDLKKARDKKYSKKRDPKYSRFYNSKDWKNLSALTMRADGYRCRCCGKRLGQRLEDGRTVTLEVDHIIPVQEATGWQRRLDPSNLQTLCLDCHNAKHKRFGRGSTRPRGG